MAKRKKKDKRTHNNLQNNTQKISKDQSEDVDERRTYNSMATTKKDMMTTKISGTPEVI
jgi:hypothetical protein